MNIAAWFTDEVIAILWAVFQSVVILLGVVMLSALLRLKSQAEATSKWFLLLFPRWPFA